MSDEFGRSVAVDGNTIVVGAPYERSDGSAPTDDSLPGAGAGEMEHRTRTGVLTGSDQRTRTTADDGVLRIEGITIGSTAWCAEAGSVLAIGGVITDVTPPSRPVWLWNRLVRILLYDDIRFVIYATVPAVVIGPLIGGVVRRRRR